MRRGDSQPLQRNNSNSNSVKNQRTYKQKICVAILVITIFSILEITIIGQGIKQFRTLKDESTQWRSLYQRTQEKIKSFHREFHKDKSKWKDTIHSVKENVREMHDGHEKEERFWEDKYEKKKEEFEHLKIQHALKDDKLKLNVLLLYADDWRYDTFGAAGNPIIHTPVLDRLAKEGMMFSHNCVTTSICWISRGTLQTGQYLSRHKSRYIAKPTFLERWNETYNYLLREVGGYYTGFVGKWHYYEEPDDGFDVFKEYYGWHVQDDIHITEQNEKDGMDFLKNRPKDKPFALTVSFFATHAVDGSKEQFIPQEKSMPLYEEVEIPVAASATEESWRRLPKFFNNGNEGRIRWKWRFNTPKKYQRMMKNYYRMATEVDTACGNLIQELKDQGVFNQTLIIFTTDNGYFHGEHGLADKWYPHQESIRVPLVIRDPRMDFNLKGTPNDEFTLNIDLAPTMLSAAGLTAPESMQGRDISELYIQQDASSNNKKNEKWRNEFFYEHPSIDDQENWIPTSEALVRKNFKFMNWPAHDTEQLFDLINDPLEEMDLADSVQHGDILKEMRARFLILKEEAK